uniref:Uncharacterized protein n=1 Tax=Haptolina brevifila TaxID=156173 RepID=A0A7S2I5A0_9EUKA|mmetsp:Transcript_61865/g.122324  ORF Transcript_61865/g.122324 Transcript_61865/m.122324 type:complete len:100 (+) Transcript_61865:134-433(+)
MPGGHSPPSPTAQPHRSSLKGTNFQNLRSEEEDTERTPKRTSWASGKDIAIVHPVWDTYYQRTFLQKHSSSICCACIFFLPAVSLLLIVLRAFGVFHGS